MAKRTDDVEFEMEGEDLQAQIAALKATVDALLEAQTRPTASGGVLTEDRLETILLKVAKISAEAQERAANPSNKTHPGISVYSYAEGDRERPRPAFTCPMYWVGFPVDLDTTTAEEIELFNQARPGVFAFTRTDGRPEKLTVTGDQDAGGALTRLLFEFPVKEDRETLPSMAAILRQAYGIKTPEQIELDALRAEVAKLRVGAAA